MGKLVNCSMCGGKGQRVNCEPCPAHMWPKCAVCGQADSPLEQLKFMSIVNAPDVMDQVKILKTKIHLCLHHPATVKIILNFRDSLFAIFISTVSISIYYLSYILAL